jgi:hypothetical protein
MSVSDKDDSSSAQPVSNDSESTSDGKSKPVSARKLAANRANAARSTGPRTAEGKARVSMNAVRHGLASQAALLPGEDADELEGLAEGYRDDLRPRGALEEDLVARIVSIAWRLRRVARAEEAMWHADDEQRVETAQIRTHVRGMFNAPTMPWQSDDLPDPRTAGHFIAGQFGQRGTSPLERLAIYEQRLGRSLHAAVRELNMLRKIRRFEETDEETDRAAPVAIASVQNKPTAPEAPDVTEPSDDVAREVGASQSPDAPNAPDGTAGHNEQNKPTARPGRFSDPQASDGSFDVDPQDTHPPSP